MSPRQKVEHYLQLVLSLQAEHGYQHGGIREAHEGRWSEEQIRGEAARRAGLHSASTAKRFVRIFREAAPDVQEAVDQGRITISAAIRQLHRDQALEGPLEPIPQRVSPRAASAIAKIITAINNHELREEIRWGLLLQLQNAVTRVTQTKPVSKTLTGLPPQAGQNH